MRIVEETVDISAPLEFPLDFIADPKRKSTGFYFYDGEFERSNYDDRVVAHWENIDDYDRTNIIRRAEDLGCKELYIGTSKCGNYFFAVAFFVELEVK